MFELYRRGYGRLATTTTCGLPRGQYDVALVDWPRCSARALKTTLEWPVHFLAPTRFAEPGDRPPKIAAIATPRSAETARSSFEPRKSQPTPCRRPLSPLRRGWVVPIDRDKIGRLYVNQAKFEAGQLAHGCADLGFKIGLVGYCHAANSVGLEVFPDQFVWIAVGRIGRQKKQPQSAVLAVDKSPGLLGNVGGAVDRRSRKSRAWRRSKAPKA